MFLSSGRLCWGWCLCFSVAVLSFDLVCASGKWQVLCKACEGSTYPLELSLVYLSSWMKFIRSECVLGVCTVLLKISQSGISTMKVAQKWPLLRLFMFKKKQERNRRNIFFTDKKSFTKCCCWHLCFFFFHIERALDNRCFFMMPKNNWTSVLGEKENSIASACFTNLHSERLSIKRWGPAYSNSPKLPSIPL